MGLRGVWRVGWMEWARGCMECGEGVYGEWVRGCIENG